MIEFSYIINFQFYKYFIMIISSSSRIVKCGLSMYYYYYYNMDIKIITHRTINLVI